MKRILFLFLTLICTSVINAQSLKGHWVEPQPIEEAETACIFLQFEENDSVRFGLFFQIDQEILKLNVLVTIDGTYVHDEELIVIDFIESTLGGNVDVEFSDEVKQFVTEDILEEFQTEVEEAKKSTLKECQGLLTRQFIPQFKYLEILELTEHKLMLTTGDLDMEFEKVESDEA